MCFILFFSSMDSGALNLMISPTLIRLKTMMTANHKHKATKARQYTALDDVAHLIIILLYIWTIYYNYYPFWAIIIIIDQILNFLKFQKIF